MVLADLYLKNGRFRSAATSFKDVLTLNPSNERAALSLALTQIALGNSYQATAHHDGLTETPTPRDICLAHALAGQPNRARSMPETAARAPGGAPTALTNPALPPPSSGHCLTARAPTAHRS